MRNTRISYTRVMLVFIFTFILLYVLYKCTIQWEHHNASDNIPDNYIVIEGYVVAKQFGQLRVANKPISFWTRLTGMITSNYGQETIIVRSHSNSNKNILKGFSYNQKVRIYGDSLKESFPPRVSAYYIEKLE